MYFKCWLLLMGVVSFLGLFMLPSALMLGDPLALLIAVGTCMVIISVITLVVKIYDEKGKK